MVKEDIQITIEGPRLTLSGHRVDSDAKGAQYFVLEINHGPFESVVEVPKEFDLSRAQTTCQNGMLRIVAPRRTFTS